MPCYRQPTIVGMVLLFRELNYLKVIIMAPAAGFEPACPERHQISFNHQIIISGNASQVWRV